MTKAPTLTLNNGVEIPRLGFGTWPLRGDDASSAVATALEAGYRLIDTAAMYGNEEAVGRGLRESGVPREDVFVTTKLRGGDHGYDAALRAFDASRERLGLDVLDLYLIHWPLPGKDRYVETWRAFEKIYADGGVRAIGVSNFTAEHIDRLRDEASVVPAVNQIELHPDLAQPELREFHAARGIATESWSPLGKGGELLDAPAVTAAAEAHGKDPGQVVLRWHVQSGAIAIPKSARPERIRSNIDVFDFALSDAEMASLTALDRGNRIGGDPRTHVEE